MAAGLITAPTNLPPGRLRLPVILLVLLGTVAITGCSGSVTPDQNENRGPSLPTPLASLPTEVQGTVALVQQALLPRRPE